MRKQLIGVALAAGLAASPAAHAQSQAVTSTAVNLYAGPAGDYPVAAQVPGGTWLTVMGCVSGYSWCDVSLPGLRGWVYGGYLNYPYQGSSVSLLGYGAAIGLPIVAFSLASYWNNNYRDRPWYGNQSRWMRHPPPRRAAPPRPGPAPRPPGHGARPPSYGGGPGHSRPPAARPGPGGGPSHAGPGGRPSGARPGSHGGGRPSGGSPGGRPSGGGPHPPSSSNHLRQPGGN
jgi:uncharacterized protein YraI